MTNLIAKDGATIALLLNGDSMIADVADSETNTTYLQTALSGKNVTTNDIRDIAQGGTSLTYEATGVSNLNWWDERTDVKGNRYTTIIDPVSDKSPYTDEIVSLGTNDHGAVEGELTKAELIDDYSNYLDQKKTDFPNLENIYIAPMCRHSYSTSDTSWQLMREVQYELAEQRSDCHMMPEFYDLALADTVHINGASVPIRSDRYASRIAFINGVGDKPTLGMQIDSAVMDDNGCLCTITHNDGTDWTLPDADTAKKLFRAESDGTFVNLANHTVEKVSATQLRINGAPWSEPRLQTVWGALGSIAGGAPDYGANITPDVPLDNSEFNLPFRYTDIVPTDTDVIRSITNLAYEIRPSYAKTYDGGTNIETVQSINGKTFSNLNASL